MTSAAARLRLLLLLVGLPILLGCEAPPAASPSGENLAPPVAAAAIPKTAASSDAPSNDAAALSPDAGPSFPLAKGETKRFAFDLEAGDFAEITVIQRGVDAIARLSGPDGRVILSVDGPTGPVGREVLRWVAEAGGEHRLDVASSLTEPGGEVQVELGVHRRATERDRLAARATAAATTAADLRRQGELTGALEAARQALDLWGSDLWRQGRPAAPEEAHVLAEIGLVQELAGQPAAAFEAFTAARDLLRPEEDSGSADPELLWRAATLDHSLGAGHLVRGELHEALGRFESALALRRRLGGATWLASLHHELAYTHRLLGETDRAIEGYTRAIELWSADGDRQAATVTRVNRARAWLVTGRYREAEADLHAALEMLATLPPTPRNTADRAWALTTLAQIHLAAGQPQQARRYSRDALRLRSGDDTRTFTSLYELGRAQEGLGQHRAAVVSLTEALKHLGPAEAAGALRPGNHGLVLGVLGRTLLGHGEAATARKLLLEADEELRHADADAGRAEVLLSLAEVERRAGRRREALAHTDEALALIEDLWARPRDLGLRSSLLATYQRHYQARIRLLLELDGEEAGQGYDVLALEAQEQSRARSLLEQLRHHQGYLYASAAPELAREELRLGRRLGRLPGSRRTGGTGPRNGTAGDEPELEALGRAFAEVRQELRRRDERFATLIEPPTLSLAEIREQVLDEETLLLEFDLDPEGSRLWVVSTDDLTVVPLAPAPVLEAEVLEAARLLPRNFRVDEQARLRICLETLSRLLLEGAAETLTARPRIRRLLIVAEGELQYLPFAVLPLPGEASPSLARPLGDRFEIVTMPSASSLAALRRRLANRPPALRAVAVVADPVYDAADERLPPPLHNPKARGEHPRLLFAGGEADTILALAGGLDAAEDEALSADRAARGFTATKARVTGGLLEGARLVHFATHAVADEQDGARSRLLLSRLDENGRPLDGALLAREIYGLDLSADLVVLSGCRTALGEAIDGEGLVGLTQAFFYAGAAQVLVSLWRVDDEATAHLMKSFYHHLLIERLPPGAALQKAQRALRQDPAWQSPFYWGAFVLQGAWPQEGDL